MKKLSHGHAQCFHCDHRFKLKSEFMLPYNTEKYQYGEYAFVTCPGCGEEEQKCNYKLPSSDPHKIDWPYDDPTIPYDC